MTKLNPEQKIEPKGKPLEAFWKALMPAIIRLAEKEKNIK